MLTRVTNPGWESRQKTPWLVVHKILDLDLGSQFELDFC